MIIVKNGEAKRVRLYANLPGSPTQGEDRVQITSRFSPSEVYVCRLVKSTGRFGKRRYLISDAAIRREETTLPLNIGKPVSIV